MGLQIDIFDYLNYLKYWFWVTINSSLYCSLFFIQNQILKVKNKKEKKRHCLQIYVNKIIHFASENFKLFNKTILYLEV